jgi:hypothetical protein
VRKSVSEPGSRAAASSTSRAPRTAADGRERRPIDAPVRRQARGYQHPPAGSHVRPRVLRAAPLAGAPSSHQSRRQSGRVSPRRSTGSATRPASTGRSSPSI